MNNVPNTASGNSFLSNFNKGAGQNSFLSGQSGYGILNRPAPTAPLLSGFSGNFQTSAPTHPVKSHEITSDGGVKVTYDTSGNKPKSDPSTQSNASASVTPSGNTQGLDMSPDRVINNTTGQTASGQIPSLQNASPANVAQPPTFPGLIGTLSGFNPFSNSSVSGAYQNAQTAQAELQNLKNQEAEALKTAGSQPMPIGELLGRQGLLANYYTAKENAAAQALQGYGSIYQGGFTGTGQQQSALSSAAGLAQPHATSQGQTTYNPLTNSFSGGSYGDNLNTVVQAIKSGNMGYTDGVNSLSGLSPTAKADVLKALGPGFDTIASDANASTRGGVIGTQGAQQAAYQSAHQQALNLQSQLTDLITTFGLNPNDINAANAGVQAIARNTSSPQYKILNNYLADVASRYSQILTPPGGSATDTTRSVASGMLDNIASGKSIIDVLNSLDQQAQAVISGVKTDTRASGTSGGSSSVSGFGWNG